MVFLLGGALVLLARLVVFTSRSRACWSSA
jgi:hypothetical protein